MANPKEEYDMITEKYIILTDPDETKEYTAKHFEELY